MLKDKILFVSSNWKNIDLANAEDILLSNNSLYLFVCKKYLGIRQADKNNLQNTTRVTE